MDMKGNRRTKGMQLTLILISASVAQAVHAEAATEMPFKYSDEWSLVSAPPPAGNIPGSSHTGPTDNPLPPDDPEIPPER